MSTALAVIEIKNPLQSFTTPQGLDPIIDAIEKEVKAIDRDISTPQGRDNIRSIAHKLARSKTALDKMGKDLTEEQRAIINSVNAERSRVWDRMEALQKEVRQPLTDWENAEKTRVEAHEALIAEIEAMGKDAKTSADYQTILDGMENYSRRDWQEFSARASDIIAMKTSALSKALELAKKDEADRVELERLRKEEAERLQREHEAKIAADAAEKAKQEAEAKAAEERRIAEDEQKKRDAEAAEIIARAEREKSEADERARKAEADRIAAAERAEQDRIAAEKKAEADRVAAVEAERLRVAEQKKRDDAETAAREADKNHRAKINNDILVALETICEPPLSDYQKKAIVTAIAKGLIPNTKITY